ncbi:MAG TPA: fructose-bisphosphatase class II, partial [Candidatus Brocadiaceae bacterium]
MIGHEKIINNVRFVRDESFNSRRIDDPFIVEAYIPERYNLKAIGEGLQLAHRNELRHPVGVVAARSLKYFGTNGEGFNVFRARGMAVWWLRHIYNSFSWWKAYVVNAEGERKDMPMLYIGEQFGAAIGDEHNEADIALSAFENDQCLVNQTSKGGVIFAVGYSERGGLFNSPDMYGIKTIVGNKYKGAGVHVTLDIKENLRRMAEYTLRARGMAVMIHNIYDEIGKMNVVILDRPRHEKLIKKVQALGAHVILMKNDDLTPTLAVTRNEVDLIVGVGGIPEAILSAIIIEKLGGEMSLRILPAHIAQDVESLENIYKWNHFKKNEIDILKNFKIVRPGTEKDDECSWDIAWTSRDLAGGRDMVFTASVIKKTPWIKFPDGKEVPGVELDTETGEIKVHVVRIAGKDLEIVPVIYRTAISKYIKQYGYFIGNNDRVVGDILVQLGKTYAEFGIFQRARECLQKATMCVATGEEFCKSCNSLYEYVEGLDALANKTFQVPGNLIEHFEKVCYVSKEDEACIRSKNMIKRYYEYLGDKNYHSHQYEKAIDYYREALKYSSHELKLYRKVNSIQMKDILREYFNRVDKRYQELNYQEPEGWEVCKLKIALDIFYGYEGRFHFTSREPWLIFFRRTVLHGEKPSYKLAVLVKLLKLYKMLNQASDDDLTLFLQKEFELSEESIKGVLHARLHKKFHSVGELYLIKELNMDALSKLLLPRVRVESQNELEDAHIPLSISLVEAMEHRYKNVLEELKEGYIEEAQEHSYAVAEAYHYVGLALYDIGDDEGAKIYYENAISKFHEIVKKFEGITPVNAQYRIGNLCEELAVLFEKEQEMYCKNAMSAYVCIADEQKLNELFGFISGLFFIRIKQARERVEWIKKELSKADKNT